MFTVKLEPSLLLKPFTIRTAVHPLTFYNIAVGLENVFRMANTVSFLSPLAGAHTALVTKAKPIHNISKNNLKILILKKGVGIDHCYKK